MAILSIKVPQRTAKGLKGLVKGQLVSLIACELY